MKCKIYHYCHAGNGLALEVLPETEAEQQVLDALWKHGCMEVNYSSKNPYARGYVVRAFNQAASAGEHNDLRPGA